MRVGEYSFWDDAVGELEGPPRRKYPGHVAVGVSGGGDPFVIAAPGTSKASGVTRIVHDEGWSEGDSFSGLEDLLESCVRAHRDAMRDEFPDDESEWKTDLDPFLNPPTKIDLRRIEPAIKSAGYSIKDHVHPFGFSARGDELVIADARGVLHVQCATGKTSLVCKSADDIVALGWFGSMAAVIRRTAKTNVLDLYTRGKTWTLVRSTPCGKSDVIHALLGGRLAIVTSAKAGKAHVLAVRDTDVSLLATLDAPSLRPIRQRSGSSQEEMVRARSHRRATRTRVRCTAGAGQLIVTPAESAPDRWAIPQRAAARDAQSSRPTPDLARDPRWSSHCSVLYVMRATCLLAGLAMGCGARLADGEVSVVDAAPAPADAQVAPLTATDFITRYGDLQCNEAFACQASYPASATTTFAASWGTTVSDCDAGSLTYFNAPKIEIDIAKGRVAFDPVAAAVCLAGIIFGTCSNFWQTYGTYPDACDQALVGSVANGGGCVSDFECASLYCTAAAKCATPT